MIRSDESLVWRCCGTDWSAQYRYCGWCGAGVLTVDRVVMRFPMPNGGDIAVVASAEVDAGVWRWLAEMVDTTAINFERHEAKKATEPVAAVSDTPASATSDRRTA